MIETTASPSEVYPSGSDDYIVVRGARTHNLRGLDVDIPRNKLVVITGVSGSGKTSLAFDTLYAEGQRRYLDSLSSHARQLLEHLPRAAVDILVGLPPTLSIEQHLAAASARATVATLTEIHDHLRVLFARAGTPHCPQCGTAIQQQSPQAIVDRILAFEAGRKVMLLAPVVRGRKGTHADVFVKIGKAGFVRARVDGEMQDVAVPPALAKGKPHTIEAVIDRIVVKPGLRDRLDESVALALKFGEGACIVSQQQGDAWQDHLYSSQFACPNCEMSFPEIEPRTFSFNSPYGACPRCERLGIVTLVDQQTDGMTGGRSSPRATPSPRSFDASGSAGALPSHVELNANRKLKDINDVDAAVGVKRRDADSGVRQHDVCPDCQGERLLPLGRAVTFQSLTLPRFSALTVSDARVMVEQWLAGFDTGTKLVLDNPAKVAQRLLSEVANRLRYLDQVGVGYLSLDRAANTLSGGEYQRTRLASCLGSGLTGVCYVLDEPTIGLHPRDTNRLLHTLIELRDQGSSVLVVEHDLDVIRQSDYVLDLGPGAGTAGGELIAAGSPSAIAADLNSITGAYLSGRLRLATVADAGRVGHVADSASIRETSPNEWLQLDHVSIHNLHDVAMRFPLRSLVCVSGVSGSGKSSLVVDALIPLLKDRFNQSAKASPRCGVLSGGDEIQRLVEVDQSPLGRSGRSNPATYSGLWDEIRKLFARTREARVRGYQSSRFSFNSSAGRCPACHGHGTHRAALAAWTDLPLPCSVCQGRRFNPATLEIKYRGHSVSDILNLSITQAADFFANLSQLSGPLSMFVETGLGHLKLGQAANTLSGGESQRIKVATELSRNVHVPTLFVLDEPTTGLHPHDISRLLQILLRLVRQGHSVLLIEHHLDVIAASDWVVDLGPDGGSAGGRIVACGTPTEIAAASAISHTGRALTEMWNQRA